MACNNFGDYVKQLVYCFYKSSLEFDLNAEELKNMNVEMQEAFLNMTVKSPRLKQYPVSKKFTRLFYKKLIELLQTCQDVHDDLFLQLCASMSDDEEEKFSFHHYIIGNDLNSVVTIKESKNIVLNGTTGLKTWEASFMLADWALCNKHLFQNQCVLELGSGVGFAGITISKFCDLKSMYMTDCHEDVLKMICENVCINFPSLHTCEDQTRAVFQDQETVIGVVPLDWNHSEQFQNDVIPDLVIGADIVYDPSILQPLCDTFKALFERNKKIKIYLQSVIRNEETVEKFHQLLDNLDYKVTILENTDPTFLNWDSTVKKSLLQIHI